MNGKFEEKLAQLAFGDLSPEESARIEAQVLKNPEAARALAEYRQMRGGLRGMAAIPDHQLSNERLRDAILTQGLRPQAVAEQRSRGFGAGWVWMPVAACALGFALITLRHQPVNPTVVLDGSGNLALNSRMDLPTAGGGASFSPSLTGVTPATKKEPNMLTASNSSGSHGSEPRLLPREQRARRFTNDKILQAKWAPVNPEEDHSSPVAINQQQPKFSPSTASTAPASPTASSPIVLIDSTPAADTGAPTATEVGTASNVLVGG